MNAALFLVYVMEENALTLLVATFAPVHEATSLAQMAPAVWVSLTRLTLTYMTFVHFLTPG